MHSSAQVFATLVVGVAVWFVLYSPSEMAYDIKTLRSNTTAGLLEQLTPKLRQKIEQCKKHKDATLIAPHKLYIGSYWNAADEEFIKANNITSIFHFATGRPRFQLEPHVTSVYHNVLRYKSKQGPTAQFPIIQEATAELHKALSANQTVLVHCMRGRSRSVSIVIAYLMEYHDYSYIDAREYIHQLRPSIGPHEGLQLQLQAFDTFLREKHE